MKNEKTITLAIIAQKAGVAIKTASKVMKNDPTVRSYIRERVLKVADELGYTPNVLAQALRNKSLNLISFHIAQLYNPFFGKLFEEVSSRLARHGYMTVPCDGVDEINETNQRMFACATILTSTDPDKIRQVVQAGPLISIDSSEPVLELASDVSVDFAWGYRQLARQLIESGRTDVVYCAPKGEFEGNMRGKFSHLEEMLSAKGLPSVYGRENVALYNEDAVVHYLQNNPGQVNAVVCSNDMVAARVAVALQHLGLGFPDQVTVAGCDGTFRVPGMWTLEVDIEHLADTAVELLIRTLKNKDGKTEQVIIRPKLITA
jgi:DNA-binding LacI/PurR family transcriptional regulator